MKKKTIYIISGCICFLVIIGGAFAFYRYNHQTTSTSTPVSTQSIEKETASKKEEKEDKKVSQASQSPKSSVVRKETTQTTASKQTIEASEKKTEKQQETTYSTMEEVVKNTDKNATFNPKDWQYYEEGNYLILIKYKKEGTPPKLPPKYKGKIIDRLSLIHI